jgi:hypothetical protein
MFLSEIDSAVRESSRKLFQISTPPVRYYLLTDIMGKSVHDAIVQKTLDECRQYPQRLRLLRTLRPDGTWPISRQRRLAEERGPGPPVGWTYITILRNLHDLKDFQTSKEDGSVSASLERILGWQSEEGFIPGPTTDLFPLPHYNGFALRTLLAFGMEKDPRVQRLARWLFDIQRPDGGWIIPYLQDVKYLPQYRQMSVSQFMDLIRSGRVPNHDPKEYRSTPSCVWSTLMVIRGMCQSYTLSGRTEVRRGAEFILNRFFKKNFHASFLRAEDNWTRLKYPTYFGSGLCALDLLTWLGYGADDPRMEKPIRWLLSARSPDGFWNQSYRPHPNKDQWITEIALSILTRYSQSLRGLPFGRVAEMAKQ